ncbi:signal peptidase II [Angustibacter peucedani]
MQTAPGASLSDAAPSSPPARRGLLVVLAVVAVGVYALDQATKALAVARLDPDRVVPLLGDLLSLRLTRNPGAAFSFATGMTWVLTLVAVAVVVVVVRSARKIGSLPWALALGLLLGGAVGNLTDRLVREPGVGRGHVVDFIAYGHLFIGNVADVAIVVAAALVVLLGARGRALDGTRPQHRAQDVDGG